VDTFETLARPGNLFVVALCLVAAALLAQGRRPGHLVLAACALAALCIAVVPIGSWLLRVLERRFPPVELGSERVDGIVVLGGALESDRIVAHGRLGLGEAGDRILAFAQLAHLHPEAQLYFAGGDRSLGSPALGDAMPARPFFESLGIDFSRVTLEITASSTHDNAVEAARSGLLQPGETWVLVTSAWHIPRAIGCFRAVGLDVVPYAVDYRDTPGLAFDFAGGLGRIELAAREWGALGYYRIRGHTDELLPDPTPASSDQPTATRSSE
jgi:uncharacterized SAM-binding protein YcdF (DUF218 family)